MKARSTLNFFGYFFLFGVNFLCCQSDDLKSTLFSEQVDKTSADTLQLAQIIFRHGQRTPDHILFLPTDPPELKKNFPLELGELTIQGLQESFTLGLNLREAYGAFVNYTYIPSQIKAMCGNDNRTSTSGQAMLAAMFPPNADQRWHPTLDWQPIPVHSNEILDLALNEYLRNCEAVDAFNQPAMIDYYHSIGDEIRYLESKTGLAIPNMRVRLDVGENIATRLGLPKLMPLPEWARNATMIMHLRRNQRTNFEPVSKAAAPMMPPMTQGWLMNELMTNIHYRVRNNTNHRLVFFSGHDSNIVTFADALNISEFHKKSSKVAFASYIALELHKINGEYFVKVFYHPTLNGSRIPKAIGNCSLPCPLATFEKLLPRRVGDREFLEICHGKPPVLVFDVPKPKGTPPPAEEVDIITKDNIKEWIRFWIVVVILMIIFLLATCWALLRTQRRLDHLITVSEQSKGRGFSGGIN